MEILESTRCVDMAKQKESWYQLEVINIWDWTSNAVCYDQVRENIISYKLYLNTPSDSGSWKRELITELTDEMRNTLKSMGYSTK